MSRPQQEFKQAGKIEFVARFLSGFLLLVVGSIVYILACVLLLPWRVGRIKLGNVYGKTISRAVGRISGARTLVEGREHLKGPAIFLCNHSSTLDMFVGMALCPIGGSGVAKKEIVKVPFFGLAYLLSGHLLIDRGNREKATKSMNEMSAYVKAKNLSIFMYPEGTRSKDGRLQKLKKGFAHVALASGLPIVPIVLHDAYKMWPPRTFKLCPGDLYVDVLPPIETAHWKAETLDEHIEEVHSAYRNALGPDQQPLPADPDLSEVSAE